MKKIKKFIKNKNKVVIAFILGILTTGTTVYAATVLSGSDVEYSNTSSKLNSTTVQGAIDEIYNNIVPIDPDTFNTNIAKTVYVSKKGVCIKRNNKLNCFKINKWDVEKNHIQQVFSDISCDVDSSYVNCNASDFRCYIDSNGNAYCVDKSDDSFCGVYSDGYAYCDI